MNVESQYICICIYCVSVFFNLNSSNLDSIFSILNGGISSVNSISMKDGKLFGFSSVSPSELYHDLFFLLAWGLFVLAI